MKKTGGAQDKKQRHQENGRCPILKTKTPRKRAVPFLARGMYFIRENTGRESPGEPGRAQTSPGEPRRIQESPGLPAARPAAPGSLQGSPRTSQSFPSLPGATLHAYLRRVLCGGRYSRAYLRYILCGGTCLYAYLRYFLCAGGHLYAYLRCIICAGMHVVCIFMIYSMRRQSYRMHSYGVFTIEEHNMYFIRIFTIYYATRRFSQFP